MSDGELLTLLAIIVALSSYIGVVRRRILDKIPGEKMKGAILPIAQFPMPKSLSLPF